MFGRSLCDRDDARSSGGCALGILLYPMKDGQMIPTWSGAGRGSRGHNCFFQCPVHLQIDAGLCPQKNPNTTLCHYAFLCHLFCLCLCLFLSLSVSLCFCVASSHKKTAFATTQDMFKTAGVSRGSRGAGLAQCVEHR